MRWMLAMTCLVDPAGPPDDPPDLQAARARMVAAQIQARGLSDPRVLAALARVPRHAFVPAGVRGRAYDDTPLPIGHGQTISQPYVVAVMTAALALQPGQRVLEVGTGSGYQAAVLAELGAEVYTVERIGALAQGAEAVLRRLGCRRVHVRHGDGYQGWPGAAPFDAILVACAPEAVPPALVDQLRVGGRLVVPVGPGDGPQDLVLLRKTSGGLVRQSLLPVRFVPMVKGG